MAALSTQQKSVLAQIRRLEAELNDQPFQTDGSLGSEETLQVSLYEQRQSQYRSQLKVYDEEIQRRLSNIRTTEDDRASNAKQLVIAKDVEGMRSQMLEKQVGSRLNYLEAQSARMRIDQSLQLAASAQLRNMATVGSTNCSTIFSPNRPSVSRSSTSGAIRSCKSWWPSVTKPPKSAKA